MLVDQGVGTRVFSYRSDRPWLIRLGLLGQLVLLASLGAAPAHASPASHLPAAAAVAVSNGIGATATAVDTGPTPGDAAHSGGIPMALAGDRAAYGLTDADSDDSPRLNGALRGALVGALGGFLVGLTMKLIRVVRKRREQKANPPPPPAASSRPPTLTAPLLAASSRPPIPAAPPPPVVFTRPLVTDDGGAATTRTRPVGGIPPHTTTAPWFAPPVSVGPPQQARRPGHRRLGRRLIAAGVAGLLLLLSGVAAVEVSRRMGELSPTDTVRAYYDALVNREAEKAKALLAPGFDWNGQLDASLLTSGVLRDPGYHPPRDVRLHEVRRDPDTMANLDPGVTVVMAEYTAAGQPYRQDFTLNPHDGDPPHNWRIANPLLPLEVPRETGALLVAGSLIRPSSAGRGFIAFPGAYTVTLPRQEFVHAKPVTLITGPTDRPPFKPTLLAAGRAEIERQVRAQLDSCLRGTWVPPEECPFHDSVNTHAPAITPETSPRIIKYPTLQFETGEWGDLRVSTASPGQVEFNPQISPPTTRRVVTDFIVIGRARLTGDTISFTRI